MKNSFCFISECTGEFNCHRCFRKVTSQGSPIAPEPPFVFTVPLNHQCQMQTSRKSRGIPWQIRHYRQLHANHKWECIIAGWFVSVIRCQEAGWLAVLMRQARSLSHCLWQVKRNMSLSTLWARMDKNRNKHSSQVYLQILLSNFPALWSECCYCQMR